MNPLGTSAVTGKVTTATTDCPGLTVPNACGAGIPSTNALPSKVLARTKVTVTSGTGTSNGLVMVTVARSWLPAPRELSPEHVPPLDLAPLPVNFLIDHWPVLAHLAAIHPQHKSPSPSIRISSAPSNRSLIASGFAPGATTKSYSNSRWLP